MVIYDQQETWVRKATAVPLVHRKTTHYIVVHHAAFVYKRGDACRSIFDYHSRKWPKYGRIGYHWLLQEEIDGSIALHKVNPHWCQGAGVLNRNHECMHVCCATNFTQIPSALWFNALVDAVKLAQRIYTRASVVGHRDIATPASPTNCPGVAWPMWKNALMSAL